VLVGFQVFTATALRAGAVLPSARAETRWRAGMFKVQHLVILLLLAGFGGQRPRGGRQASRGSVCFVNELPSSCHRTEIVSPFITPTKEDQQLGHSLR